MAFVAAFGLQVLLLGLSAAHNSLPGDIFQVARTSAAATTTVVSAFPDPQGRNTDIATSAPSVVSILAIGLLIPLVLTMVGPGSASKPRGRLLGATGCRGPPALT